MGKKVTGGWLGSQRARVRAEVKEHYRTNKIIRRARHGPARRLLRWLFTDRSVPTLLAFYAVVLALALIAEWWFSWDYYSVLPGWTGEYRGFLKDFTGFLLAGQIGILAIVAVAVAVITLIVQDEGASSTTNVRLYYAEGFAFELTRSGVALAVVLLLQLFWPLQHLLHALGFGTNDLVFKVALTVVHAGWLALNLCLFLFFIITSLHFVEPDARARMRKQYTAGIGIVRDVSDKLFRHFYLNAAQDLLEPSEDKGPTVGLGHSPFIEDGASVEITRRFREPMVLSDVLLTPLGFVVRSWVKRTRAGPSAGPRHTDRRWPGTLVFPVDPDDEDGVDEVKLALRDKGAALRLIDRIMIRLSFRFRRPARAASHVSTPTDFIEDLVSALVASIEKGSFNAFKKKLTETIDYHRFALAALNTEDLEGRPVNLAEVGGMWERPEQKWAHEYRAAFSAAASKIGSDPQFTAWLGQLPAALFPRDGLAYSANVLNSIIELGLHHVAVLEAWVTKQTLATYDPENGVLMRLSPSDQAAYEGVLIQLVSSWESLAQTILLAYRIRKQGAEIDAHQWMTFRRSWSALDAHISATAYFVTSAVWNEDEAGASRYRDVLLRWLNPFYDFLGNDYQYRNRFLVSPDLFQGDWEAVRPDVEKLARYQLGSGPSAGAAYGLILRGVHEDVITITSAVVLSWYAREQQSTDIGGRTAVQLLRGQRLDEGSDMAASISQARPVFRIVFDFLLRQALDPGHGGSRYAASLGALVQLVAGVAAKRMVPGRIYSGWGLEDVDSLRHTLLAILAANMPASGDDSARRIVSELLNEGGPLREPDAARGFGQDMDALINVMGETPDPLFVRTVIPFGGDLDVAEEHARLRALLVAIRSEVQEDQRVQQVRADLDPEKLAATRARISDALLAEGPDIHVFEGVELGREARMAPLQTDRFGVIDRGAFTDPPFSVIDLEEYVRIIVDVSQDLLARFVWRELYARPREVFPVAMREGIRQFWRTVIARSAEVGAAPTILVPYDKIGEGVGLAGHGLPNPDLDEFKVTNDDAITGGGGTAYLGTIEGVKVFSADLKPGTALLFSGRALSRLDYGVVTDDDQLAAFDFEETSNPSESWVTLQFAQITTWDDSPTIEFIFDPKDLPD